MATRKRRPPSMTPLGALIEQARLDAGMSYEQVQNAGGPSRQTTWNLVKRARMVRPPSDTTIAQLAKAVPALTEDAIRDAIAASMGLQTAAPAADDWAAFGRLLDQKASEEERDLVLAAARGMWEQLRKRRLR